MIDEHIAVDVPENVSEVVIHAADRLREVIDKSLLGSRRDHAESWASREWRQDIIPEVFSAIQSL
jgi:hypothetical protein